MPEIPQSIIDAVAGILRPYCGEISIDRILGIADRATVLVTRKEACEMLKCSNATLLRYEKAGKLRFVRPTKRKSLIDRDSIESICRKTV